MTLKFTHNISFISYIEKMLNNKIDLEMLEKHLIETVNKKQNWAVLYEAHGDCIMGWCTIKFSNSKLALIADFELNSEDPKVNRFTINKQELYPSLSIGIKPVTTAMQEKLEIIIASVNLDRVQGNGGDTRIRPIKFWDIINI